LNTLALSIMEKNIRSAIETVHSLLEEGKDPSRLIEDMIQYYRDLLLYKSSKDMAPYMERIVVSPEFEMVAEKANPQVLFGIIEELNRTQQEMKWTNHPRVLLEVCLVKLCQNTNPVLSGQHLEELDALKSKIRELETVIGHFKESGIQMDSSLHQERAPQKPVQMAKSIHVPKGKIEQILEHATKQNLQRLKTEWKPILDKLKVSYRALLNSAEPVAASSQGCIISFKYKIHCQMAMSNKDFLQTLNTLIRNILGEDAEIIGIPEEDWLTVRTEYINNHKGSEKESAKEEDLFIEEALKLVGEDLLEIKD